MAERIIRAHELLTKPISSDSDSKRKERITACHAVVEALSHHSLRTHLEYSKLVAVAIAGLLAGCNDEVSDVRLNADEALNRVIKSLMASNLGRLQMELYKAIKNTELPLRSLRAALLKFADLIHLVKPAKRKSFVTSLLPSLHRVINVNDESIQETLAKCMEKFCDALGLFFNDSETKQLLDAFISNMTAPSPVIRRTASDAIIAICKGSRRPFHYLKVFVDKLFAILRSADIMSSNDVAIGCMQSFRKGLICFQELSCSLPDRVQVITNDELQRFFEQVLIELENSNNNRVTATLEALSQTLRIVRDEHSDWFDSAPARHRLDFHSHNPSFILGHRLVTRLFQFCLGEKEACQAINICLPALWICNEAQIALDLFTCSLTLRDNPYWLVKTELLEIIGSQDYFHIACIEDSLQSGILRLRAQESHRRVQDEAMDVVFQLVADQDGRVREIAGKTLAKLLPHLYSPVDWQGQDALTTYVEKESVHLHGKSFGIPWPGQNGLIDEALVEVARGNLSRITKRLISKLRATQSHIVTTGIYSALRILTSTEVPDVVRSISPIFPMPLFNVADILSLAIDHLKVAWITSDLGIHVDIMALIGQLFRDGSPTSFRPYVNQLLSHVLRVLNICCCIVRGDSPPNSKHKGKDRVGERGSDYYGLYHHLVDVAAHISTEEDVEELTAPAGAAQGYFSHLPYYLRLFETLRGAYEAHKVTLNVTVEGKFAEIIKTALEVLAVVVEIEGTAFQKSAEEVLVYLQGLVFVEPKAVVLCVQQLLVALFATYKPSLDRMNSSSEESLLNIHTVEDDSNETSNSTSGFFERCIVSSRNTSRHRLKTAVKVSEVEAYPFGSMASVSSLVPQHVIPPKTNQNGSVISLISPRKVNQALSSKLSSSSVSLTSGKSTQLKSAGPSQSSLRGRLSRLGSTSKTVSTSVDRSSFGSYIRLFEPLVMHAMTVYTTTSDLLLQQQVLFLINRLISLRVNYVLLDKDLVFLGAIREQVHLIESGYFRGASSLLRHIFQFLVLVSSETDQISNGISIPEIIGMADSMLASDNLSSRQAIVALRPIVHELFTKTSRTTRSQKDMELVIQREVIVSTLIKFVQFPAVLDQMCSLLKFVQVNGDMWRTISRILANKLLHHLSKHEITVANEKELAVLHQVLANLEPMSLTPLSTVIKSIFLMTPLSYLVETTRLSYYQQVARHFPNASQIESQHLNESTEVFPGIVLLLRFVSQTSDELILQAIASLVDETVGSVLPIITELRLDELPNSSVGKTIDDSFSPLTPPESPSRTILQVDPETDPGLFFLSFVLDVVHQKVEKCTQYPQILSVFEQQVLAQMLQALFGILSKSRSRNGKLFQTISNIPRTRFTQVSKLFITLSRCYPILDMWWCQILSIFQVLDFDWWEYCIAPVDSGGIDTSRDSVQRGSFLLFCEFLLNVMERQTSTHEDSRISEEESSAKSSVSSEQVWNYARLATLLQQRSNTWFHLFVKFSDEAPVQELCQGLFRQEDTRLVILERISNILNLHVLSCLEQINFLRLLNSLPTSSDLIMFLLTRFSRSQYVSVRSYTACASAEKISELCLSSDAQVVADLHLAFLANIRNPSFFPQLVSVFQKLGVGQHLKEDLSIDELAKLSPEVWLRGFVTAHCSIHCVKNFSRKSICELLNQLDHKSIETILNDPSFDYSLLVPALRLLQAKADDFHTQRVELLSFNDWTSNMKADEEFDSKLLLLTFNFVQSNVEDLSNFILDENELQDVVFRRAQPLIQVQKDHEQGNEQFSWLNIVHLSHALATCLQMRRPSQDLDFASFEYPINHRAVISSMKFCVLALRGMIWRLRQRYFVPWELDYVLNCIQVVQSHPGCSPYFQQKEARNEFYVSAMTELFYCLYHSLVLSSPLEPSAPGSRSTMCSMTGEYFLATVKETCFVHFERRNSAESRISSILGWSLHRAFLLARYLSHEFVTDLSPRIIGGIFHAMVRPAIPDFILRSFKSAILPLLRFQIEPIHRYIFSLRDPSTGETNSETEGSFTRLGAGNEESMMILQELIMEEPLLHAYVRYLDLLGWTSQEMFHNAWALLWTVFSTSRSERPEDELNRLRRLAIQGVTTLLLQTSLRPTMGDPTCEYLHVPRTSEINFLQTQLGKRLEKGQHAIFQDRLKGEALREALIHNLERPLMTTNFGSHQMSVAALRSANYTSKASGGSLREKKERSRKLLLTSAEIEGCLAQIRKVYTQWIAESSSTLVVSEVLKSTLVISDIFEGRGGNFQWMLSLFLEMAKQQLGEDDYFQRYLVVGICKCVAVLHITSDMSDHFELIQKLLIETMNSNNASSRLAGLQAFLYLLDGRVTRAILPMLESVAKVILGGIKTSSDSMMMLVLFSTAFGIIEQFPSESEDLLFTSQVLAYCATSQALQSNTVFDCVINGLGKLQLTFVLGKADRELIDSLASPDALLTFVQDLECSRLVMLFNRAPTCRQRSLISLLLTCMYTGKETDHTKKLRLLRDQGNSNVDVSSRTLNRIVCLLSLLSSGFRQEIEALCRVLPLILEDFLPSRQMINIVMSELSRSDGTESEMKPESVAWIVWKVFETLQFYGQQASLREWAVVSIPRFVAQPGEAAAFGLSCLFASASHEKLVNALVPYMITSREAYDPVDITLFWLSGLHFYLNESLTKREKKLFLSVFQAQAYVPFVQLAAMCTKFTKPEELEGDDDEDEAVLLTSADA